jgi:excisionase family DNA binding protein
MDYDKKHENLTYTVDQTARMLGISRNSAYALVREGRIPALRLGKRIVIPRVKLQELLSSPTNTVSE